MLVALLQIGIGVGLANGWILALVPVVLVIVYRTAIRHEEAYLERKRTELPEGMAKTDGAPGVITWAAPQSITSASPNEPIMMLSGLRSRWITPWAWANATAPQTR